MMQCEHGHYYDPSKHSSCPNCRAESLDFDLEKTVPQYDSGVLKGNEKPSPWNSAEQKLGQEEERTVALARKEIGIDPVVGWLVCIEGSDKGRDYRIRSEKNFIGRSEAMDIYIKGDDSISRENHAIISFDPKKVLFRIHAGDSRGLVYLNDEMIDTSSPLQAYDVIELGQTKLIFVPCCGEHFKWK